MPDITPNNQPFRKRIYRCANDISFRVQKGEMTIDKIAKKYKVPKMTQHDCISSSKVPHGTKPGCNQSWVQYFKLNADQF